MVTDLPVEVQLRTLPIIVNGLKEHLSTLLISLLVTLSRASQEATAALVRESNSHFVGNCLIIDIITCAHAAAGMN
jgi:hypothetical protein